ncbi:hypothetical protein MHYP_G00129680 [Metynnis hypsauchen]
MLFPFIGKAQVHSITRDRCHDFRQSPSAFSRRRERRDEATRRLLPPRPGLGEAVEDGWMDGRYLTPMAYSSHSERAALTAFTAFVTLCMSSIMLSKTSW